MKNKSHFLYDPYGLIHSTNHQNRNDSGIIPAKDVKKVRGKPHEWLKAACDEAMKKVRKTGRAYIVFRDPDWESPADGKREHVRAYYGHFPVVHKERNHFFRAYLPSGDLVVRDAMSGYVRRWKR